MARVTDLRHDELRSIAHDPNAPVEVDDEQLAPRGAPLRSLAPLLRDEPGLTRAFGEPDARLAVVEVARPISIAALATLSNRRPLLVACPTGTMARPAPRRSRPVPRRGRTRAVPRLGDPPVRARQPERRDDGPAPRRAVAPAGPRPVPEGHRRRRSGAAPEARPRSARRRTDGRAPRRRGRPRPARRDSSSSSATDARKSSNTAASSPAAARSSTCTRRRADAPIRIDLWGDEVDRLTTIRRQRPALDRRPRRGAASSPPAS